MIIRHVYLSKTSSDTTGESDTLISIAKNNEPVPGNMDNEKDKAVVRSEAMARSAIKALLKIISRELLLMKKGIPSQCSSFHKGCKKERDNRSRRIL